MQSTSAPAIAWDDDDRRHPVAALPHPEALIRNLTRGVLEVHAGIREPGQLARFLTYEAYRQLVERALVSARGRSRRATATARLVLTVVSVRWSAPADDAIEAVVIVALPGRVRAVTMRLQSCESRWRATSFDVI